MRVLITRPRKDARPLADALEAVGIQALIGPLMVVVPRRGAPVDLDGVQAVLATSANGVRALASETSRRDVPLLAVGDATARKAADAGFQRVQSAGGDVDDLARLVVARLRPDEGPVLHVAGTRLAGDLAGALKRAGFAYRRAVLYEARPLDRLPPATAGALREDSLQGVLFFSPRTAKIFGELVDAEALARSVARLVAFCLSAAVADRAARLPWRQRLVSPRPDQAAMIDLVRTYRG